MEEGYYWIQPKGEGVQIGIRDQHNGNWYTCGTEQAAPEPVVVGPRVKGQEECRSEG